MGLDMYMFAHHKTAVINQQDGNGNTYELPVRAELGYWRKHPDLHSYIETEVWPTSPDYDTQKDGPFNCIAVPLTRDAIERIIELSDNAEMPTSPGGFFFNQSQPGDNDDTVMQMKAALQFLEANTNYSGQCDWEIFYFSWW
jgi:hypothetical protein